MADENRSITQGQAILADGSVTEVVKLARPDRARPAKSATQAERLDYLCDVFLSDHNGERHRAIHRMRMEGISTIELIDHVIPNVAAMLGQRWADDRLSFIEVTIGSARLQETVRALIARELSSTTARLDVTGKVADPDRVPAPRVLMVIPRPEYHTLGAFVAADQFRRFGYDVDVALDQHPKQIAATLRDRRYCMIGISIAGRRTLASSRELVDIIRSTVTHVTPIVLGGSLLAKDQDLKMATGVDHVAITVRDALEICGLNILDVRPSSTGDGEPRVNFFERPVTENMFL